MGIVARLKALIGDRRRSKREVVQLPARRRPDQASTTSWPLRRAASARLLAVAVVCALAAVGGVMRLPDASAAPAADSAQYVVVYQQGANLDAARQAVRTAGGVILSENAVVGVATVRAADARFTAKVAAMREAIYGVTDNAVIGQAPDAGHKRDDIEREPATAASGRRAHKGKLAGDPLADLQWNNQLIGATTTGSYAHQQGSHAVRVGIMDSGLDGNHPDIAPNFDRRLSRNFVTDLPQLDGPCEHPERDCVDPADEDDHGHGTHVAGTIAGALNGIGTSGVAPRVDLVSIRAGQDSGYFFLKPVIDALVYAGDNGIDVVNMSFFIDPWLFNCTNNPADSAQEQAQQRAIIEATTRAASYAHARGVTMIAAIGNESTDLGHPTADVISPDLPSDTPHNRTISNDCLTLPSEAPNVLDVSAVAPPNLADSNVPRKAFYSNYGREQTVVAAPGGDSREFFGTPRYNTPETRILAPYPLLAAQACGEVDAGGVPNGATNCNPDPNDHVRSTPLVRDCANGVCALYQWAQGTSMAAPHAVGVAAIIVAQLGRPDPAHGGLTANPDKVERVLRATATPTPCPTQEPYQYPFAPGTYDATCDGTKSFNGFYGSGIVNALAASKAR